MLRDLRPGATLFVLDKKERKIGQAVVTNSVLDIPFGSLMQQPQTMTLSFKYDERDIVLTRVNASAASADDARGSGLTVCESSNTLANELKAYKAYNEEMSSKKQYFDDTAAWCGTQLLELDPAQKVKAEYESKIDTMMSKYEEMFNAMKKENDDLRSRLESRDANQGKE